MKNEEREFGLVPNRSTPDQYIRLVRWEGKWCPCVDEQGEPCEEFRARPLVWQWALLDVRTPNGLVKRWVPVDITVAKLTPPLWPRGVSGESETMRRLRILELRRVCHVDHEKGRAMPQWVASQDRHVDFDGRFDASPKADED